MHFYRYNAALLFLLSGCVTAGTVRQTESPGRGMTPSGAHKKGPGEYTFAGTLFGFIKKRLAVSEFSDCIQRFNSTYILQPQNACQHLAEVVAIAVLANDRTNAQ